MRPHEPRPRLRLVATTSYLIMFYSVTPPAVSIQQRLPQEKTRRLAVRRRPPVSQVREEGIAYGHAPRRHTRGGRARYDVQLILHPLSHPLTE
eukprot:4236962-Lingulodinium_polyedra.AAC.2